jgi:hypothetical protein
MKFLQLQSKLTVNSFVCTHCGPNSCVLGNLASFWHAVANTDISRRVVFDLKQILPSSLASVKYKCADSWSSDMVTTGHHQSTTGADIQLTTGPSHQVTSCHQFAFLKNAEFMKYTQNFVIASSVTVLISPFMLSLYLEITSSES